MTSPRVRIAVSLIVLGALAAGCGGGAGKTDNDSKPFQQALRFLPRGGTLSYDNWRPLRVFAGASRLSSQQASQDDLVAFLQKLSTRDSPYFAAYPPYYLLEHRRNWGWDELDLRWDASVSGSTPGIGYVLGFRPDFPFERMTSKLEHGGWRRSTYRDVPVYTIDESTFLQKYNLKGELALRNVGVLPDEHLAFLSFTTGAVHSLIDAFRRSPTAVPPQYATLAKRDVDAASAYVGPASCGLPKRHVKGAVAAARPFKGHRYETIALASRVEGKGETTASVAFHYASGAQAQRDLALRERAARSASSIVVPGYRYNQLFKLTDASTDGSDLILELAPAGNSLALWQAFTNEDMLFALC